MKNDPRVALIDSLIAISALIAVKKKDGENTDKESAQIYQLKKVIGANLINGGQGRASYGAMNYYLRLSSKKQVMLGANWLKVVKKRLIRNLKKPADVLKEAKARKEAIKADPRKVLANDFFKAKTAEFILRRKSMPTTQPTRVVNNLLTIINSLIIDNGRNVLTKIDKSFSRRRLYPSEQRMLKRLLIESMKNPNVKRNIETKETVSVRVVTKPTPQPLTKKRISPARLIPMKQEPGEGVVTFTAPTARFPVSGRVGVGASKTAIMVAATSVALVLLFKYKG